MTKSLSARPRILFLFSDTGGGHRSAAEAIIEALELQFKGQFSAEMVDIFKQYAPQPLNRLPNWYPYMVRVPEMWGLGYWLSDGHGRARLITNTFWPYVRRAAQQLVQNHPSDLIVSVHPLATAPVLRALGRPRPPFVTVVTDMVSVHALWYHRRTDLCLVATEAARCRALRCGLLPEQVQVVGLPVADRFCQPAGDKTLLRQRLGWPQDRLVVLLVGGGEGMGPLEQTANAIAAANLPLALAVITGRNASLKTRLEGQMRGWPIPAFVYGFVRDMPAFMQAADILVTKAGPGTISEAFNAGLPMLLYSRLPGQEDGNITYVVEQGAGLWAPRSEDIVAALRRWIEHPEQRLRTAQACRRQARPQAARHIARILGSYVGLFQHSPNSEPLPAIPSTSEC